jgi:hypothetical protein
MAAAFASPIAPKGRSRQQAVEKAARRIPLKAAIVSINDGAVLSESWV